MQHYYIPDVMYSPEERHGHKVKHSVQFDKSVEKDQVIITVESDGKLYGVRVELSELNHAVALMNEEESHKVKATPPKAA